MRNRKTLSWQPINLSEVLLHDFCRSLLQGNLTELGLLIPSFRLGSLTLVPLYKAKPLFVPSFSQEIHVLIRSYIPRKFFFFFILFSERAGKMVKLILCLCIVFFSPLPVLHVISCQYSSNTACGLSQTQLIFEDFLSLHERSLALVDHNSSLIIMWQCLLSVP